MHSETKRAGDLAGVLTKMRPGAEKAKAVVIQEIETSNVRANDLIMKE
jgi:hypothetical protein